MTLLRCAPRPRLGPSGFDRWRLVEDPGIRWSGLTTSSHHPEDDPAAAVVTVIILPSDDFCRGLDLRAALIDFLEFHQLTTPTRCYPLEVGP